MDQLDVPCGPRVRLDNVDRIRRECVRLYRDGKVGRRQPGDVAQLTTTLVAIAGLITTKQGAGA